MSLKRSASLPVDELDAESKSKKPRFWAPGQQPDFPPSAVPSLFDIARLEGVRQLDALEPKEMGTLLASMIAQELKVSGQVQFVPEMVALQRMHEQSRMRDIDQLGSDAIEKLADRVNAAPDPTVGDDYDIDELDEMASQLQTSNDAIGEFEQYADELKVLALDQSSDFSSNSFEAAMKEPKDAFAVHVDNRAEGDALSVHAQWEFLTGRTTEPLPAWKERCCVGVLGGASCSFGPFHSMFFCQAHSPQEQPLAVAQVPLRVLGLSGPDEKKKIKAGQVLDVFSGVPFYGSPGPAGRVMQVRPGVWLNGAGHCTSAAVNHAPEGRLPNAAFQRRTSLYEVPTEELDVTAGKLVVLVALRDIGDLEEILI